MEWFAFSVFMIIIFYSYYPDMVRKLEKKIKKIERSAKGDLGMSKIISSLVGDKCKIMVNRSVLGPSTDDVVDILEVDEEWVKVSFRNKKGVNKTIVIRVEDINRIEVVSE